MIYLKLNCLYYKIEPLQIIKKDIKPIIKEELVNTENPVINKGW